MQTERLYYARLSPFARRCVVAALELDLGDRLTLVDVDVWNPEDSGIPNNPVGKVPALVTADGTISGSLHICIYLDALAPAPKLFPADPDRRRRALQISGLAEGIMEAGVGHVVERLRRPQEFVWPGWLKRQERKVLRTLEALAAARPAIDADIGSVTLGCALSYLDIRMPDLDWRGKAPALAAWHQVFAARPAMARTQRLLEAQSAPQSFLLADLPA